MDEKYRRSETVSIRWICRPLDESPVIALFRARLHGHKRLFEYGSGYSTLFFSKLVGDVVSLEYDPHEKISKELPKKRESDAC